MRLMDQRVFGEVSDLLESFPTDSALVRSLTRVGQYVLLVVADGWVCLSTMLTYMRSQPLVFRIGVVFQVRGGDEVFRALLALELAVQRVFTALVFHHRAFIEKPSSAEAARELPYPHVSRHVAVVITHSFKPSVTYTACVLYVDDAEVYFLAVYVKAVVPREDLATVLAHVALQLPLLMCRQVVEVALLVPVLPTTCLTRKHVRQPLLPRLTHLGYSRVADFMRSQVALGLADAVALVAGVALGGAPRVAVFVVAQAFDGGEGATALLTRVTLGAALRL